MDRKTEAQLRQEICSVWGALDAERAAYARLNATVEELSAALAVKDEAMEEALETLSYIPDAYAPPDLPLFGKIRSALALQPHADVLNKIRADAVREGLTEWEGTTKPIYKFMREYADRIENGEA